MIIPFDFLRNKTYISFTSKLILNHLYLCIIYLGSSTKIFSTDLIWCFNCSNSLVTLPFLLRHYIGPYIQIEIVKWWMATIKQSFRTIQYGYTITFIYSFWFWSSLSTRLHCTASYIHIPFATLTLKKSFCTHLV